MTAEKSNVTVFANTKLRYEDSIDRNRARFGLQS